MDQPFIMNLADAPALSHPRRATIIDFEPDDAPWPEVGVNVQFMRPGQPNCRYHSEPVQEDFLVLHGECVVIVDGEEKTLRQWDFLHCPAGTQHVFVGAGDGPCAVLMRRPEVWRSSRDPGGASMRRRPDHPVQCGERRRGSPDRRSSA